MTNRHAIAAAALVTALVGGVALLASPAKPGRDTSSPTPSPSISVHLTFVTPTRPQSTDQPGLAKELLRITNAERARHHLRALVWWPSGVAAVKTQTHHMLTAGHLFHNPELSRLLDAYRAQLVGENVGLSDSLAAMQTAFMNSREHRDNILNPDYRLFSAWVVRDERGELWATINFVQLS